MAEQQPPRKRAALSTAGRGSRGLLHMQVCGHDVILAATAITRTENTLHTLRVDKDPNMLTPMRTYSAPAEVWSLAAMHDGSQESDVIVGTRRGYKSAVEIWSLRGLEEAASNLLDTSSPMAEATQQLEVNIKSHLELQGSILHVRKRSGSQAKHLCVTQSGADVVDLEDSKIVQNVSFTCVAASKFETSPKTVDGDWVNETTAFIASRKALCFFDTRSGDVESCIDTETMIRESKIDPSELWVAPHPSRISSACSDGSHVVYTGGEDGCLRAFDMRTKKLAWQVRDAHSQWVSALRTSRSNGLLLSGGTDGVVRCWTKNGEAQATFPQHDDTVTNMVYSDTSFTTVSYDGRIAINEMPTARN